MSGYQCLANHSRKLASLSSSTCARRARTRLRQYQRRYHGSEFTLRSNSSISYAKVPGRDSLIEQILHRYAA